MGCGGSKDMEQTEQSRAIERMLQEQRNTLDFKVLLLGAGESGKSTVVKQLKSVYKVQLDREEIELVALSLHNNCLVCMQVLLQQCENYATTLTGDDDARAQRILDAEAVQSRLSPAQAADIAELWALDAIKKVYAHRDQFWLLDCCEYYFAHVLRFAEAEFTPTEEDIIMARVRTTGILVTEFDEKVETTPLHFRVVDVAGQKGERKKWIHCFDDVKAIVFVVSLPGYNKVMFEDPSKNQMIDALELFGNISNNPAFKNSELFLFLNKKDLFEEMLRTTPLTKCFPDYTGTDDVKDAIKYVEAQFASKMSDATRQLYTHDIAARFKKDIKYSWEEVKKVLVDSNRGQVARAQRAGPQGK